MTAATAPPQPGAEAPGEPLRVGVRLDPPLLADAVRYLLPPDVDVTLVRDAAALDEGGGFDVAIVGADLARPCAPVVITLDTAIGSTGGGVARGPLGAVQRCLPDAASVVAYIRALAAGR